MLSLLLLSKSTRQRVGLEEIARRRFLFLARGISQILEVGGESDDVRGRWAAMYWYIGRQCDQAPPSVRNPAEKGLDLA
jgi:hypothetical protein